VISFGSKITLRGPVPAKKNNWKPRPKGGGVYTDRTTATQIDGFIFQARSAWGGKPVVDPAIVHCTFYVPNYAGADGDNMQTTVLDVLQKAGVIRNDNRKGLRGWSGRIVVRDGDEATEVEVWEAPRRGKAVRSEETEVAGKGQGVVCARFKRFADSIARIRRADTWHSRALPDENAGL